MSNSPDSRKARAARRRADADLWPVRRFTLGQEPTVDPLDDTTIDERLAQVWPLTLAAWSVSGKPLPDYSRSQTPIVRKTASTAR